MKYFAVKLNCRVVLNPSIKGGLDLYLNNASLSLLTCLNFLPNYLELHFKEN